MRLAVLTTVLPAGRRTGGEIVSQALVDAAVAAGHDVHVLGYRRSGDPAPAPREVLAGERPIETAGAPKPVLARWLATSLVRREPYSASKYRSAAYAGEARRLAAEADAVVVDHAQAGWAVPSLPRRPTAFVAHNVEAALHGEGGLVHRREARLLDRLERRLATTADQVWAIAADDAAHFRPLARDLRLLHVPGRAATGAPARPADLVDVAILGTWTWEANADGLRWFCERVLPALGGTSVHVGGVGAEWLHGVDGVTYHGRVPDADAFLASARVVAIPSVAGSGVQVKTLDALSLGCWVVATPTAVRGIDGSPAVVAGSPEAFAAAVRDLLADDRTLGPCEPALAWSAPRRERFEADVAAALADLGRER